VRQIPVLQYLTVPEVLYPSARNTKGQTSRADARHSNSPPRTVTAHGSVSPTSPMSPTSPLSHHRYSYHAPSPTVHKRSPPPQILPGLWPRADNLAAGGGGLASPISSGGGGGNAYVDRTPAFAQPHPQRYGMHSPSAYDHASHAMDTAAHGHNQHHHHHHTAGYAHGQGPQRVLASPARPTRIFQNRSSEDEKLIGRFTEHTERYY
jgi:hypothetical protein